MKATNDGFIPQTDEQLNEETKCKWCGAEKKTIRISILVDEVSYDEDGEESDWVQTDETVSPEFCIYCGKDESGDSISTLRLGTLSCGAIVLVNDDAVNNGLDSYLEKEGK